jgi:bifunctional UDP-N-acetylglucosamine pyrophosphorylase/glucosamine-1-phosphate N-acetyltransferase
LGIDEVNVSCYCFDAAAMFDALQRVDRANAQGEFYLTDVLGIFRAEGRAVIAAPIVPAEEAEGINTPDQLASVDRQLRQRVTGGPAR